MISVFLGLGTVETSFFVFLLHCCSLCFVSLAGWYVHCQLGWGRKDMRGLSLRFKVETGSPAVRLLDFSPINKAMRSYELLFREGRRGQKEVTRCL